MFYQLIKQGGQLHSTPLEYMEIIDETFELKLLLQFGGSKDIDKFTETEKLGSLAYQSAENKYESERARKT